MRELEAAHPELITRPPDEPALQDAARTFSPPKLHHINIVSRESSSLLNFSTITSSFILLILSFSNKVKWYIAIYSSM